MADNLPTPPITPSATPSSTPLGRAALERVLARAAELQGRSGDDDGGALTEAQLIDLAKEVGLSRENVRQALAEERVRLELAPESGAAFAMLGGSTVQAARTVPGTAATVLGGLDQWMQRAESLQVRRRFAEQLSWEPKEDFVSTIRRALRVGGRGYHLAGATEVHGIVVAVEGQRSHVRLVANLSAARNQRAGAAMAAVAAGLLIGVPLFWMATDAGLAVAAVLSLIPALALPAAAVSIARRRFRAMLARAQVSLEQALDRLEFGDGPRRQP